MSEQAAPRILIVGPSWVGDMVMAQSLFISLKAAHPQAAIDVLAPAWSRPIVAAMPEVRQSIDMPVGHGALQWGMRRQVADGLKGRYDWALVLPNSLKSALIPWMAGIPRRSGWRGEMRYRLLNDLRVLDKSRYPLMVQRFVALGLDKGASVPERCPAPCLNVTDAQVEQAMSAQGLASSDGALLALCPGAEFGQAKQWPKAHYAAVAEWHIRRGGRVWLFGSAKDQPVCQAIVDGVSSAESVVNLAGKTSLADAVALLACADAVVSNDSGLMHVAAALQRPLVAIYGSTSPDFTPPLGETVVTIKSDIDCSPCFERECPYGHYRCLKELMPEAVIEALDQLPLAPPRLDARA